MKLPGSKVLAVVEVDSVGKWISIAVGVQSIAVFIFGAFVAWLTSKLRGDFAEFKVDLIDRIDKRFDGYVEMKHFQLYSESHAKEHIGIEIEIAKLREFRHDMNGELRGLGAKLEDLAKSQNDMISRLNEWRSNHS